MSQPELEANKQFVRKFFAAMDAKRFDEMEALIHPDHLFHLPMAPKPYGKKAHMEMNINLQKKMPIVDRVFHDQIAEGDRVVSRGVLTFRHDGEMNGVPGTGERISVTFIHIMRIKDGLNIEEWDELNAMPLLKAFGVVPKDGGFSWH